MKIEEYNRLVEECRKLHHAGKLPSGPTYEQRISWAYGQCKIENPAVTMRIAEDGVRAAIQKWCAMRLLDNKSLWSWIPGMATLPDDYGRTWRYCGATWTQESGRLLKEPHPAHPSPDVLDAATTGCLLGHVRCMENDSNIHPVRVNGMWGLSKGGRRLGSTEAEAVVHAIVG